MSNNPIDLSAIIEGLCTAQIDFILVGGLAAVVQGAPITTFDVDIVHDPSEQNIEKLVSFLNDTEATFRLPNDNIIKPEKHHFLAKGHALLKTKYGPLDILAIIEQEQNYASLLPKTVEIDFRGHKLKVLSLEALIELKEQTQDPKYLKRMAALKNAKKASND